MKLYNTESRQKEEFIPLEEGKVKMYVCGPTVYNYIHIGNARSAVAFDVIRRYLMYRGYEVEYISNFTDVDDKIIRRANELNISPVEVANRYIEAYKEDTAALNVLPATQNPRVMDYMDQIIAYISDLIEKGYAYESDGDVYFSTRSFADYGKLSHQSIDELEVGASQRTGEEQSKKKDPLDFALWKQAKPGEIKWESPFGEGRPGWHIECSVMANSILGETIDIHGGGQDLEFPHHENEIAQSECHNHATFAHYWLHNGYVTVGDGEKMSKSLGNFTTVRDLLEKMPGNDLRFFMATTHYRRPLQFSAETLEEAKNNMERLQNAVETCRFYEKNAAEQQEKDPIHLTMMEGLRVAFINAMDDDFNVANGMTAVYELVKWVNQYVKEEPTSKVVLGEALALFAEWYDVLGLTWKEEDLLDEEIEALIEKRNEARKNKDFATSDAIRDELKEKGILLDDTRQGTKWRRV